MKSLPGVLRGSAYTMLAGETMSVETSQCDFDDPASVVLAFVAAMNGWEVRSWQLQRACRDSDDPSSYQPDVLSEMAAIFALYCTPKERKFGRNGSF
jgi:hypothetical protein